MIQIGAQKIGTNIFLASLAGCADLSFRLIAREEGAEFCFYEMSDCGALIYASGKKNNDMHRAHPQDLPIAFQLLGSEPELMVKAAQKMLTLNEKIAFVDINAACPMRKVIAKKSGAYLIKEPERLYRIVEQLASALNLPVTIKMRIGYEQKDVEKIAAIAKRCEECGAQALFVHGRTQRQKYSGAVDYESIKAMKESVKIPVFASGDIFSPLKAREMLELTRCDGVLVARGALGNPWIFKQIKHYLKGGVLLPGPTLAARVAVVKRHLNYIEEYKTTAPKSKVGFARKVTMWYLKSLRHATVLKDKVNQLKSFSEIYALLDSLNA